MMVRDRQMKAFGIDPVPLAGTAGPQLPRVAREVMSAALFSFAS